MKTLLIADDEPAIRMLYRREFADEGYNVVTASSAKEAIEIAREALPDLVILDIRMPGMDGLEAMGRILEENNEMPVVINTAFNSYQDSFLSWPADAYVTKSADLHELKQTVHAILEDRATEAAIAT